MVHRHRANKRLKISTGVDADQAGSTSAYRRKVRSGASRLASTVKTDEEKRLEEQLFGLDYSAEQRADGGENVDNNEELDLLQGPSDWLSQARDRKLKQRAIEAEDEEPTGLAGVDNDDLFMLDGGAGPQYDGTEEESDSASEGGDGEQDEHPKASTSAQQNVKLRKAVWHDPADAGLSVSLQDTKRLRKLRDSAREDVISGTEYELRLRRQFQKIHPPPAWAVKAQLARLNGNNGTIQHNDDTDNDDDDENDSGLRDILARSSVGLHSKKTSRRIPLPREKLAVERLRDANQVDKSHSPTTALQFHPSASVLFTASEDRRLRLYQIDGVHNPLLQSVHTQDLPISSAAFHPSGSSIMLAGLRPFYYSYDLQAGRVIRSPKGLWAGGLGGSDGSSNDIYGGSMELFKFSPDGRIVAVAGRRGYVHLLDWGGNGTGRMGGSSGGQVIGNVKISSAVKGITWTRNGTELVVVGEDAQVYSWDLGTRTCIDRWADDGGFGPTSVESDRLDRYFAIGSRSGVVNLYDRAMAFPSAPTAGEARQPMKVIMNLTTSISTIRFNRTSELMAIASRAKGDSLKLVHLPSATVFPNWPTAATPLGHVKAVDFSTTSQYLAVGGHKGKVLLYSLQHYAR